MTIAEIRNCELAIAVIVKYRDMHTADRPCWTDEWAYGYLCALRDTGNLTQEQWEFLCTLYADVVDELVEEELALFRRR